MPLTTNTIYRGAVAPESITLTVTASGTEDLSTVTAACIWAKRGTTAPTQWPADILSQTRTSITLCHVLQVGDVDIAGKMSVVAYLTTPSGIIRSKPVGLIVTEPFAL